MRSKLRSLSNGLLRGLLRLERTFRRVGDPPEARQVLVLEYRPALGFCVHMTPVFEALKRGGKTVIVATRGMNLELLRHSPFVDHLIETPDPTVELIGAIRALRGELRAHALEPDCVLTGPADQRTKVGLLAAACCGGWRGGYTVHDALYDRPLRYDRSRSRIANNLALARLVGCDVDGFSPRVYFSRKDVERAGELLAGTAGPVLAVMPFHSGGLPTAWVEERWGAVLRFAQEMLGFAVVYLGTAADLEAEERIRGFAGGTGTSLLGQTSATELAAVLALCDVGVGIMTGAMHVSRAVGLPTLALGLAWEPALEWMTPLGEGVRMVRGADRADRPEDYRMEEVSVEWVQQELAEMALRYPASAEARERRVIRSLANEAGRKG